MGGRRDEFAVLLHARGADPIRRSAYDERSERVAIAVEDRSPDDACVGDDLAVVHCPAAPTDVRQRLIFIERRMGPAQCGEFFGGKVRGDCAGGGAPDEGELGSDRRGDAKCVPTLDDLVHAQLSVLDRDEHHRLAGLVAQSLHPRPHRGHQRGRRRAAREAAEWGGDLPATVVRAVEPSSPLERDGETVGRALFDPSEARQFAHTDRLTLRDRLDQDARISNRLNLLDGRHGLLLGFLRNVRVT